MVHGYSLRSNTKGRRRHQSTDKTKEQVKGTNASTGASTSSTSEGRHKDELEGESGTVDLRPATPDTPRASHNSAWHSRSIITSSLISAATATTTTRYRIEGRSETWEEDIRAARKREETRRTAEAVRIRREQIVCGYEEELRALRARIVALRRECEVKVERARRKWEREERDWAIERGVGVVVMAEEDGDRDSDSDSDSDSEDADGEIAAIDKNHAYTETSSLITNNDDNDQQQQQQQQWPSRSSAVTCWSHRSESNFPAPPPPGPPVRKTQQQHTQHFAQQQQQQQDNNDNDNERGPEETRTVVSHTGTSKQLPGKKNHPLSQGRKSPHSSRLQPLRRQPAQLMVIPTSTPHGGLEHTHDGDNNKDSEMDG